jgi:restriction endonuclease S subunit
MRRSQLAANDILLAIVCITSLLMTGNTLPRLQMNDIESLPIPVPPAELQEKLCTKINDLRAKAHALREQARTDLEKAKRDIESLILSDTKQPNGL